MFEIIRAVKMNTTGKTTIRCRVPQNERGITQLPTNATTKGTAIRVVKRRMASP